MSINRGIPIVNLPNEYMNGLQNTWVDENSLTIGPGSARDSTNTYDIVLNNTITLDITHTGVNGVDVGPASTDVWYYIYVISDPVSGNPTGSLLSLNLLTPPAMPFGYSAFRLIGALYYHSGGNGFQNFYQTGASNDRKFIYDGGYNVTGGAVAVPSTVTPLDLGVAVPPINGTVVHMGCLQFVGAGGTANQHIITFANSQATSPYPFPYAVTGGGTTGSTAFGAFIINITASDGVVADVDWSSNATTDTAVVGVFWYEMDL